MCVSFHSNEERKKLRDLDKKTITYSKLSKKKRFLQRTEREFWCANSQCDSEKNFKKRHVITDKYTRVIKIQVTNEI